MMKDSSDEEHDDDSWDEWRRCSDDADTKDVFSPCLFCKELFKCAEEIFKHCQQQHQFNIVTFSKTHHFNDFSYIKFVNYVRKKQATVEVITDSDLWQDDVYMLPILPDDILLQFDVDDLKDLNNSASHSGDVSIDEGTSNDLETVTLTRREHEDLLTQLHLKEKQAQDAQSQLLQVMKDMESMRKIATNFMMSNDAKGDKTDQSPVLDLTEDEDDSYFSSYSHFGIHAEMLKDKVRTDSYRDFIYKNSDIFKNKIVLDIGCGTGILSMFAARAGASKVIGVDQSDIVYQAMDIVRQNDLHDKITIIKGKMEDITLPVEKVDIIISEWMGYFLLFESMLDTVIYARDKWLCKESGLVFPDGCSIRLAASNDSRLHERYLSFWDDVYRFKMSCMKTNVVNEAIVEVVNSENIISTVATMKEFSCNTCSVSDLDFSSNFSLVVTESSNITAFIGFFDIFFQKACSSPVMFSTSPSAPSTHWKQTVFLLDTPLSVNKDDVLQCSLSCRKNPKSPRGLLVTLDINENRHSYIMD